MHGNGNDFILIDEYSTIKVPEETKSKFAKLVCNRNFAIGADGVIFVQRSKIAHVRFRYFNKDGSEAAMCGNGVRCFARYVFEEGYVDSKFSIETLSGIVNLEVVNKGRWWIKVDIGKPDYKEISKLRLPDAGDLYYIDVGVPHVIIFVENLNFDIIPIAKKIRYNTRFFPHGTNVNFVNVMSGKEIAIRTYERGVEDETLCCGTGSIASALVAHRLGLVGKKVVVNTSGGKLEIEIGDRIYMYGSASRVLDGELHLDELYEVSE